MIVASPKSAAFPSVEIVTYSNELTDYLKDVPKNLIGLENTGVGF